ncbi:hypothetical protein, partial [Palaeococcus ferrophilus]|uniref:hypothetical protein n=1 Tax=Palaeococcus ferrophilus TaxID=83868 RepID=UPI0012FC6106
MNIERREEYSRVGVQITVDNTQISVKPREVVIFNATDANNNTLKIAVLNVDPFTKSKFEKQLDGKSATLVIGGNSITTNPIKPPKDPILPPIDPGTPIKVESTSSQSYQAFTSTLSKERLFLSPEKVEADYVVLSADKAEPDAEVWFAILQEDSHGNH